MVVRTQILKYSLLITFVSCFKVGEKFFRTKKRIVSGVEKLEIMRFSYGKIYSIFFRN